MYPAAPPLGMRPPLSYPLPPPPSFPFPAPPPVPMPVLIAAIPKEVTTKKPNVECSCNCLADFACWLCEKCRDAKKTTEVPRPMPVGIIPVFGIYPPNILPPPFQPILLGNQRNNAAEDSGYDEHCNTIRLPNKYYNHRARRFNRRKNRKNTEVFNPIIPYVPEEGEMKFRRKSSNIVVRDLIRDLKLEDSYDDSENLDRGEKTIHLNGEKGKTTKIIVTL